MTPGVSPPFATPHFLHCHCEEAKPTKQSPL